MALSSQVHMYTIDTSAFYTPQEQAIDRRLFKRRLWKKKLEDLFDKCDVDKKAKISKSKTKNNAGIKKLKEDLKNEFIKNKGGVRDLNPFKLRDNKIVSVFESALTRTFKLSANTLTKDIFIIQTFYFSVIEDLIKNGFTYNREKYVCFTASAGQIRTKKTVFLKESLLQLHSKTLMCGLTEDGIGEININKYLAYLALCNSATDKWNSFNIEKAIVVDDMETEVEGLVDFIDEKTYKIERKKMNVNIPHTDGCGMMLPSVSRRSFMVRLPWMKGLLVTFPFDKFIKEKGCSSKIKDIYGKEYDIIEDNIEIIFTKSQFKLWDKYSSWDEYKEYFVKYECEASYCNKEETYFKDATLNYQVLQSLTDVTDEELTQLASRTNETITKFGRVRGELFRALDIHKGNTKKDNLQRALELYPNLIQDKHTRYSLRMIKKYMVKDALAGKLKVRGKYTFVSPDLYAFCEFLFQGNNNPQGLLKNGEVSCKLYSDSIKVDCLRNPSLYREHPVRMNVVNSNTRKWFCTNAIYTSVDDLISKILQFDKLYVELKLGYPEKGVI